MKKNAAPLFLILGEKGGPGKSWMARCLADVLLDWFLLRRLVDCLVGVDGDCSNPSFRTYYGHQFTVVSTQLQEANGWRQLGQVIVSTPSEQVIIVDTPANCYHVFTDHYASYVARAAERANRPIFVVWPITETRQPIKLLGDYLQHFDPRNVLVVKNGRFGPAEDFYAWNQASGIANQFRADGGMESYLPRLHPRVVDKIEQSGRGFSEMLTTQVDKDGTPVDWDAMDEIDLEDFIAGMRQAFEPLRARAFA